MAGTALRDRLSERLIEAMQSRDGVAVAALRTAVGELGNREAIASDMPADATADRHIAGSRSGLYAAEAVREPLSERGQIALLRALADSWEQSAVAAEAGGHAEAGARLREEAAVITQILAEHDGGASG